MSQATVSQQWFYSEIQAYPFELNGQIVMMFQVREPDGSFTGTYGSAARSSLADFLNSHANAWDIVRPLELVVAGETMHPVAYGAAEHLAWLVRRRVSCIDGVTATGE